MNSPSAPGTFDRRGFFRTAGSLTVASFIPSQLAQAAEDLRAPRGFDYFFNSHEEEIYASRVGSFTKAMPHADDGLVSREAYAIYLETLKVGPAADFELVPLSGRFRLANPQAAYACINEGMDPKDFATPQPPVFASAELAAEAVELYWHALLRDVPFCDYQNSPLVADACRELSRLKGFSGPRTAGEITARELFRGSSAGNLTGPYLSQFLIREIPFGATRVPQKYKVPVAGDDHLVSYREWLNCQRGYFSKEASPFRLQPRHLVTGRDLAEYVRRDFSFQAFLNATLILLGEAYPRKSFRAPFGSGHPYLESDTQTGFATFGAPYVLDLVTRVANCALKACWQEKWLVHRRLRPEEFGGHVHNHLEKNANYPIHADLLGSVALQRSQEKFHSGLLPQAYPDGCPIHPAYPAGHAATAGACVTILKALFDGSYVFPEPVEPTREGDLTKPYRGPGLTVSGELEKLASNISFGRNFAGIHWRSDASSGLALGETVALQLLREQRRVSPERSGHFTFKKFSGESVSI
jgi:hypothetical protein